MKSVIIYTEKIIKDERSIFTEKSQKLDSCNGFEWLILSFGKERRRVFVFS